MIATFRLSDVRFWRIWARSISTLIAFRITGALISRKQGIYFSMVTFALAEIVYFVINQAPQYTGGEDGLHGIVRGSLFGLSLENQITYYYVALFVVSLAVGFVFLVIRSPFGPSLKAKSARQRTAHAKRRLQRAGTAAARIRLAGRLVGAIVSSLSRRLQPRVQSGLESVYWRVVRRTDHAEF